MRKGGVKTTGTTKTDKVALHDDKSLHTGVYGREVEDEDGVSNASSLVDRDAKADARGVVGSKKKKGKGKGKKKKEEKEEEALAACMKKMRKGGVKTTGTTKTDKVVLHDDKSLHTGVYGREVEDEDGV